MSYRQRTPRKRVLVVEGSAIIRRLIEVCLRPLDVDITLKATGQDGAGKCRI